MILTRYLALADNLFLLTRIVPVFLANVFKRWVLGDALCFFSASFAMAPALASVNIVTAISVYRMLFALLPLADFRFLHQHANKICK